MLHMRWMVLGLLILLSGCGLNFGRDEETTVEYEFSFDGIKLISPQITHPDDPNAYNKDKYTLTVNERLLLRFETLSDHVTSAKVKDTAPLYVQVYSESPEAEKHLQLCPITKSWMMLATWNFAHPFGPRGRWAPGGDISQEECMTAERATDNAIRFNATRWFINYPQGRSVNHGFVLIADAPVVIVGELSGNSSPRLIMSKFR